MKEVKSKLLDAQKPPEMPAPKQLPDMSLADVCDRWLRVRTNSVRPATLRDYSYHLNKNIKPVLGSRMIGDLAPADVEDLLNGMQDRGLSASNRRGAHSVLRNILNYAVRMKWVSENVAFAIAPPPPVRAMNVLTLPQVKQLILEAVGHPQGPAIVMAATLGMRQGEVLGLPWRNVDMVQRVITVDQALQIVNGKPVIVSPKTRASVRQISMPQVIHDMLMIHREEQLRQFGTIPELVSVTKSGKPVLPSNCVKAFKKMLVRSQLPSVRFHDLRHTAATLMLENKMDPFTISRTLGHSDVRITLNTYTKLTARMSDQVAEMVDSMYGEIS